MSPTPLIALYAGLGVVAGLAHFALLADSTRRLTQGGAIALTMLAIPLRFGLSMAVLLLAARQGWAPLLAAALGWTLARVPWTDAAKRRSES